MAADTENPKKKFDRTWLYVGAFFVLGWVVVLYFFGGNLITSEYLEDGLPPVQMADFSWEMLDLEGKPVSFSKYKGKTIVLNIWATNCGPCVMEMPSIAKLASDPRLRDVAFLCVAGDESAEPVKQFISGKNWPMTMLRVESAPPVFMTDAIPATFIIAPDGKIVTTVMGAEDWDNAKVLEMLMELSKPNPPAPGSAPKGSPTTPTPVS